MSIKLKENFFFNALADKAMYCYYREIAKEYKATDENRKLFFLKEYFLPAEEQWIKSITNPRSDYYFTIEKGWFENPEEELSEIYKEGGINGVKSHRDLKFENKKLKKKLKKTTKEVSKWQLKKFDILNALPKSIVLLISPIILLIFAILSLLSLPQTINTCKTLLCITVPLLLGVIIVSIEICCKQKLIYSRGIHLILPRLSGSIIAGWLMISFASNVFPQFYAISLNDWEFGIKNIIIDLILLSLTFVFVYDEISRKVPYLDDKQKIGRTFSLLFIAFSYSYIIGIVATALIGTETIKPFDDKYIMHSISFELFHTEAYVSPGFLFVFTFVAMFIGLFINRIFDDKHITNSE
jgi:hypothetical protein